MNSSLGWRWPQKWADGCLCKLHLHEHIVDWSSMVSSCTHMLSQVLSFPLNCWVTVPCHPPWPFPFSLLCSVILPPISPTQSPKSLSFLFFFSFHFHFFTPSLGLAFWTQSRWCCLSQDTWSSGRIVWARTQGWSSGVPHWLILTNLPRNPLTHVLKACSCISHFRTF